MVECEPSKVGTKPAVLVDLLPRAAIAHSIVGDDTIFRQVMIRVVAA